MGMTFPVGRLHRYDWKKEDGKYTTKEIGAALFHVSWQEYQVSIQIRDAFSLTV